MSEPTPQRAPNKLWPIILLLGLAGASLFVFLMARQGWGDISRAFAAAGWGVAAVVAFHAVPMFFDVLGWRVLLPREGRPSFPKLYAIRWMGDSVSAMLPVAQVGGEIVRVTRTRAQGVPLPIAAGSVLVSMTTSLLTQIIFTLSGLFLLASLVGGNKLFWPALTGAVIAVLGVVGFYMVQRVGIFRIIGAIINHITSSGPWADLASRGRVLDDAVRAMYARRGAVLASCGWTLCVWATGAAEVWIALAVLGAPGGYARAFVLESVSQAIRSAFFLVPGAIGVQEGGYALVGALLGISPADCMALALIRRVRELAFGVPGVAAWQWVEGFAWWKRRKHGTEKPDPVSV